VRLTREFVARFVPRCVAKVEIENEGTESALMMSCECQCILIVLTERQDGRWEHLAEQAR
jgi:hypothetical protein